MKRSTILARYRRKAAAGRPYTWFNYQPINLPGFEETLPLAGRNCFDRLQMVVDHLPRPADRRPLRIVDWGCNLGFFTFELARLGHQVIGIDSNPELIGVCRHLAASTEFPIPPEFVTDQLSPTAVERYGRRDVALCFSVLHHIKKRNGLLDAFATAHPLAFIEMDGPGYGHRQLFSFYWDLEEAGEARDRYGGGTKRRKTWWCRNHLGPERYRNIKPHNIVAGRGVFEKRTGGRTSVIKRQLERAAHTWIRTGLDHEVRMYRSLTGARYFPRLLDTGSNRRYRWMEIERVEPDGRADWPAVVGFFDFLRRNRLFLIDLTADSFLFTRDGLKVVDLESLFRVESTIEDLVESRTRKDHRPMTTYDEQLAYLRRRLTLDPPDRAVRPVIGSC